LAHPRAREERRPVDITLTSVSFLRDGKIVRVRNYSDQSEALEAVELRE